MSLAKHGGHRRTGGLPVLLPADRRGLPGIKPGLQLVNADTTATALPEGTIRYGFTGWSGFGAADDSSRTTGTAAATAPHSRWRVAHPPR